MNHPQSRWLRMRSLLLLAPLLVAATPSPRPLGLSDWKLGFDGPPLELKQNECTPVTVQTQTLGGTGVNLGYNVLVSLGQSQPLGTFHSQPGCLQSPIAETLIPAGSMGKTVYYKPTELGRMMLFATENVLGLNPGVSRPISVVISFTSRLEFTTVPTRVRSGNTAQVTVTAFDEAGRVAVGYAGRVVLSSNLAVPELPLETHFEPTRDAGVRTFTLTFPTPGDYQLKIQDLLKTDLLAQSPTLPVLVPRVSVVPSRRDPGTCESMTFALQVVDDQDQPSQQSVAVKLCRPSGSPASLVPSQTGDDRTAECALRLLQGGLAQHVTWTNSNPADIPFILQDAEPVGDLTVSWKRLLSPQHSSLSFEGSSTHEPTLASYNQQLPVRFVLKDTCGAPLVPPGKTLRFKTTAPLVATPASQPSPGVWTALVALAGCPANPSVPLLIQPAFDDTLIYWSPNQPFQLRVQPQCSEPLVELSIRSKEESPVAKPGAVVELEVKLENKGTAPITGGVLQLSSEGLTLLQAQQDGAPLALEDNKALLKTLEPDKTITVRITAQTTTQLDQPVSVMAQYTTPDGAPLTPEKGITFNVGDMSVNVGCGSQPATLPGHLVAWLVLLLAASRPWERSRRLRERERIDRQAPW